MSCFIVTVDYLTLVVAIVWICHGMQKIELLCEDVIYIIFYLWAVAEHLTITFFSWCLPQGPHHGSKLVLPANCQGDAVHPRGTRKVCSLNKYSNKKMEYLSDGWTKMETVVISGAFLESCEVNRFQKYSRHKNWIPFSEKYSDFFLKNLLFPL